MHSRIARNILYPLHERLVGRPTFRLLRELERSQWYTPDELRELQAAKLTHLFHYAANTFPDYRRWFESHRFDPARHGPFDILRHMPLLDKRDLRRRFQSGPKRPENNRVREMTTGGSTGEPLTFFVDPLRSTFDKVARMRSHRWFNVRHGDREVYLWGAPIANKRQDRVRTIRDFFLNDRLISAFDLAPHTAQQYLRTIIRFNPACLFGYPSSLFNFCRLVENEGVRPQFRALRAVFVTGEVLDDQQRRTLENFFNVPVANGYGGRDSGSCAHECPAGGMHVTSEHVIMEIVDADGQPSPPGESGEIVITNLDNHATPFIRYRTGDIGRMLDAGCPCGRGLELMDVIDGRRTDHLVAADGTLRHALSLIYLIRDAEEIDQFQIHQRSDKSIDLRVVAPNGFREDTRARLLDGLGESLGRSLPTHLEIVDRIDLQPSGKFRHVISDAAQLQ